MESTFSPKDKTLDTHASDGDEPKANRIVDWFAPEIDFNWSAFWHEPNQFSTFEHVPLSRSYYGPLSQSYYQRDQACELIHAFDELAGQIATTGQVLEIGCGNGAGAAALLEATNQQQRSLDIDAIDTANIHPPPELTKHVRFHKGNAECIGFPDETFDAVLSCFCIEFCRPLQVLSECCRVLKRGGQLAMLIYARESPFVAVQSKYVGIFRIGLQKLLDAAIAGESLDLDVIQRVLHHIEEDVPQPHFQAHMKSIITHLMHPPRHSGSGALPAEEFYLPGLNEVPNVDSMRSLKRRLSLMQAIDSAALDFKEARQLCRESERLGFDDPCVIPVEFNRARLCWLQTGEKW